jgi:hypothetical protein
MLTIILDPHLKNMKTICDFVGDVQVIKIVVKYDLKILCLILL